jgi:extracellular elastinolytic metalloproteinase
VTHYTIKGIPGAVNDVTAQLAYAQTVPTGSEHSVLSLVWRLEMEMEDTWYEATVDAYIPSRIVTVVDWVTDAALPLSRLEQGREQGSEERLTRFGGSVSNLPMSVPSIPDLPTDFPYPTGRYNVFKFGIRDPESPLALRISQEPYMGFEDMSPYGWHALPWKNNPTVGAPKDRNGTYNSTTTWGNNASV